MLAEVEARTRDYADARGVLAARMEALRRSVDDAQRGMLPGIRDAAGVVARARNALRGEIERCPEAFVKPRTRVFVGIRVGWKKGAGRVVYGSAAAVVLRIRQLMPARLAALVKTTEAPVRAALSALPAEELAALGVEIRQTGDQVVITPQDDAVDKTVAALLEDAARIEAGGRR